MTRVRIILKYDFPDIIPFHVLKWYVYRIQPLPVIDPGRHHTLSHTSGFIMAKTKGEGVSKAQMVRDAIAALGDDGKPQDIQQWIADKYKTDINTTMISSYKSNMKKGGGKKGGRGKGGDIFNDIATIQDLLGKHGRPNLEKLIAALDK